jgi:hypothetical protein
MNMSKTDDGTGPERLAHGILALQEVPFSNSVIVLNMNHHSFARGRLYIAEKSCPAGISFSPALTLPFVFCYNKDEQVRKAIESWRTVCDVTAEE